MLGAFGQAIGKVTGYDHPFVDIDQTMPLKTVCQDALARPIKTHQQLLPFRSGTSSFEFDALQVTIVVVKHAIDLPRMAFKSTSPHERTIEFDEHPLKLLQSFEDLLKRDGETRLGYSPFIADQRIDESASDLQRRPGGDDCRTGVKVQVVQEEANSKLG